MDGAFQRWSQLSAFRKAVALIATVAVVALVILMASLKNSRPTSLLFGGLDTQASAQIVATLDRMGEPYDISEAGIFVSSDRRERLRLAIADSRPFSSGTRGYEVFVDAETVAQNLSVYWQSKEQELAQTLLALPDIKETRVSLRPSADGRGQVTASISLTTLSGDDVSASASQTARALIALAAPRLAPSSVTVLDERGKVVFLATPAGHSVSTSGGDGHAERLKESIEHILTAIVGNDTVKVAVNIETKRTSKRSSKRSFDPESKTLKGSKTVEIARTSKTATDGGADNATDGPASERNEIQSTDRYDYSENFREVTQNAGAISRITVAVLIDSVRRKDADGSVVEEERSRADLTKIENLVKSTIGFDAERGDLVTVESVSFVDSAVDSATAPPSIAGAMFNDQEMLLIIQLAVAALVVILLGVFVVRPVLLSNRGQNDLLEDDGDEGFGGFDFAVADMDGIPDFDEETGEFGTAEPDDIRERLQLAVSSQLDQSANVLKTWLSDPDSKAGNG